MFHFTYKKSFLMGISFLIFSLLSTAVYPFWPILGGGVLSGFGLFGAKAAGVKSTLAQVGQAVIYTELFLFLFSLLIICSLGFLIVRFLRNVRNSKKYNRLFTLLASLQSDITLLKSAASLSVDEAARVQESRKKILKDLFSILRERFFARNIDAHLLKRMTDALNLMQAEKLDLDSQLLFVDQWVRHIAVMVS